MTFNPTLDNTEISETSIEITAITLNCQSLQLDDDKFFQFCQDNRDLRFERNARGDITIMPPTGGETSERNSEINFQLRLWNNQYKLGKVFDSSGGFKLPNGAEKSPDASWIPIERWNALTPEQRQKFLPLCPDFVIELLSPSDILKITQDKMQEYLANGTKLGWLINRKKKQVEIYRAAKEVEILNNPQTLSGEDILPQFVFNLESIW